MALLKSLLWLHTKWRCADVRKDAVVLLVVVAERAVRGASSSRKTKTSGSGKR